MPSLQQLRYLVALADIGHFRRAAEACNVTQPTLSGQLKELETKLDVVLFERTRARVVITSVGEAIAEHARNVLREVDEIRSISTLHKGPFQNTIRVGIVQSLGSYLLPPIIPDLHKNHPILKFYVREGFPKQLLEALGTGGIDLLFCPLPVREKEYEVRSLFREPLYAVIPHDHRFATETEISPEMLKGETILALERGHRLFEQVEQICHRYGAILSQDYEGTSLDTLRQMVAMGMGLSLLPALYVKSEVAHQDIVVARPFRGAPPSRVIGMVWRRSTAYEKHYHELSTEICQILRRVAPELTIFG